MKKMSPIMAILALSGGLSLRHGRQEDSPVILPLMDPVKLNHKGNPFTEHDLEAMERAALKRARRAMRKSPHSDKPDKSQKSD